MSSQQENIQNERFRIGSVSRLTSIPTDTLRIWERRYGVVSPERSKSGTRFYSHSDITRLALIKQLVEQGNAISTVANLTELELKKRIGLNQNINNSSQEKDTTLPCKVIVCGDALPLFIQNKQDELQGLEIVASFKNPFEAESELGKLDADILLMEFPAFQDQDIGPVQTILKRYPNLHPILVYGFATRATLELLNKLHISTIRAPIDAYRLKSECQKALNGRYLASVESDVTVDVESIPSRRFTQQQLMNLANQQQPNSVKCECPKHHADILYSLYAFEDYNIGCQTSNDEDVLLHRYIYDCTIRARYMMEQSLTRLIETDNLNID